MSDEIIETETPETDAPLESALDKAMKKDTAPAKTDETTEERPPMDWPMPVYPLVAKFDVQAVTLEDESHAFVVAVYTGAGASFGLMSREGALALASRIKKVVNSNI